MEDGWNPNEAAGHVDNKTRAPKFTVRVNEPEKKGEGIAAYIVYKVCTTVISPSSSAT
jgi:hypothetical protein